MAPLRRHALAEHGYGKAALSHIRAPLSPAAGRARAAPQ